MMELDKVPRQTTFSYFPTSYTSDEDEIIVIIGKFNNQICLDTFTCHCTFNDGRIQI